jgi:predicted Zn finger-like uncharacterized protein
MRVECPSCLKAYKIPDDKLPSGKRVAVSCLSCKSRIIIDLRPTSTKKKSENNSQPKNNEQTKQALPQSFLDRNLPSGMKLKFGIMRAFSDLPAMPHIVSKAQEIMADPHSDMKSLSQIIEHEQSIVARVLKLANSAYYGLSGKVSTIQHASVLLGHKTIGELISLAGISGFMGDRLKGYGLESGDMWRHSLAVAIGSRIIAKRKKPELDDTAFNAGIMHDVGKIVLDPYIYERREAFEAFMQDDQETFFEAEMLILGFDHSEIAFELCQKWNLPENQRLAIRFHHHPSLSENNDLAYIVHVADVMAIMSGFGTGIDSMLHEMENGALKYLGLQEKDLSDIMKEAAESVKEITEKIHRD